MENLNLSAALFKYIEDHTSGEDPVLSELRRYTYLKVNHPRMLSGHVQGKFLELISKIIRPSRILEIGTFTGYSAICLSKGLIKGGKLITLEINDELEELHNTFFNKAGITGKVERITGDALEIIPGLKEEFDLVFIDAEKEQYIDYYRLIMPKLRPGGIIIADNVLWDGKVIDDKFRNDTATKSIREFNALINNDKQTENIILPIRDGLQLIRKL